MNIFLAAGESGYVGSSTNVGSLVILEIYEYICTCISHEFDCRKKRDGNHGERGEQTEGKRKEN